MAFFIQKKIIVMFRKENYWLKIFVEPMPILYLITTSFNYVFIFLHYFVNFFHLVFCLSFYSPLKIISLSIIQTIILLIILWIYDCFKLWQNSSFMNKKKLLKIERKEKSMKKFCHVKFFSLQSRVLLSCAII